MLLLQKRNPRPMELKATYQGEENPNYEAGKLYNLLVIQVKGKLVAGTSSETIIKYENPIQFFNDWTNIKSLKKS